MQFNLESSYGSHIIKAGFPLYKIDTKYDFCIFNALPEYSIPRLHLDSSLKVKFFAEVKLNSIISSSNLRFILGLDVKCVPFISRIETDINKKISITKKLWN